LWTWTGFLEDPAHHKRVLRSETTGIAGLNNRANQSRVAKEKKRERIEHLGDLVAP
jgi:hypothetical protein